MEEMGEGLLRTETASLTLSLGQFKLRPCSDCHLAGCPYRRHPASSSSQPVLPSHSLPHSAYMTVATAVQGKLAGRFSGSCRCVSPRQQVKRPFADHDEAGLSGAGTRFELLSIDGATYVRGTGSAAASQCELSVPIGSAARRWS